LERSFFGQTLQNPVATKIATLICGSGFGRIIGAKDDNHESSPTTVGFRP
jgi:hypothetical protein